MRIKSVASALALLAIGLLAGCGGSSNTPASSTLGGVAAVGAPIVNGTIKVSCAAGSALTTTTNTGGVWQVTLSGQNLPCAVQVGGGNVGTANGAANTAFYHSIATAPGTVNVTPLTDLMVANLAGTPTPAIWFAGLSTTPAPLIAISNTNLNAALAKLRTALSQLTPLNTINPITTAFTPTAGNTMDNMLVALATAMTNSATTYTTVLNNASATGFTPLPAAFGTALQTAAAGAGVAGANTQAACTAAGGMWDPFINVCLGGNAGAGCPAGQVLNPLMVCVPAGVTGGGVAAGTLMGGAKQGTALNLTTAVTSLAGSGILGALDGTGLAATFNNPSQITTDGTNLYVADLGNNKIRQIVIASGAVTTLAGSGTCGNVDGTGIAALFCLPSGITTDGANLYVADTTNQKIRRIVIATGVVTTLAGSGLAGAVDATGIAATFNNPNSITTDGTNLYVTELANNKIRKIVIATGVVTTLAGSGAAGALDGTGIAASFNQPHGITTDGANLYVADTNNNKIRKIVIATGAVSTLVNGGVTGINLTTLVATVALFTTPSGITTDGTNLYITDINKVHKIIIATGGVTTLAGGGGNPPLGQPINGTGVAATFLGPAGITTDGISLYVADTTNYIIRKIQ